MNEKDKPPHLSRGCGGKLPITRILVMNELGYPVCVMARYMPATKFFLITVMENTSENLTRSGAKTVLSGFNLTLKCQPTDHLQVIHSLKASFEPDSQIHTIRTGPDKGLRAHCFIMNAMMN